MSSIGLVCILSSWSIYDKIVYIFILILNTVQCSDILVSK